MPLADRHGSETKACLAQFVLHGALTSHVEPSRTSVIIRLCRYQHTSLQQARLKFIEYIE